MADAASNNAAALAIRHSDYGFTSALSAFLADGDSVELGALLGRFLGAGERLGDLLEALALRGERPELGDLVGAPGLAVAFEFLAHALAFFFAGAFFFAPPRPFFVAGPLAARASISSIAWL